MTERLVKDNIWECFCQVFCLKNFRMNEYFDYIWLIFSR